LGLDAEQIMVPVDHLLLPEAEALPAIVVVRLGSGLTHFVVVWRLVGGLVQVMDPGRGRRWATRARFLQGPYVPVHAGPAEGWREWAGSASFLGPLSVRLARVGATGGAADALLARAQADPTWCHLAALDATTRVVDELVRAGGVPRGAPAR